MKKKDNKTITSMTTTYYMPDDTSIMIPVDHSTDITSTPHITAADIATQYGQTTDAAQYYHGTVPTATPFPQCDFVPYSWTNVSNAPKAYAETEEYLRKCLLDAHMENEQLQTTIKGLEEEHENLLNEIQILKEKLCLLEKKN